MFHSKRRLLWVRQRFELHGNHSGYDLLCDAIAKQGEGCYHWVWGDYGKTLPWGTRRFATHVAETNGSPFYHKYSVIGELKAIWQSLYRRYNLIHVMCVEDNLGLLSRWRKLLSPRIVGTAHQPANWWRTRHRRPENISALDALIVTSRAQIDYFQQYLSGKVYFIPHGVDTDFFSPQDSKTSFNADKGHPRCIFCGLWLRDLDTLAQVVEKVARRNKCVKFDMVIPEKSRSDPHLRRIVKHSQVSCHGRVSDEQLRNLYSRASMLILPLLDCAGSNTLLEAMACGLPIVSNAVGGIPDYTDNSFADLVPVGDINGFVESILKLIDNPQECKEKGLAARAFVEQNFAWDKIARKTIEGYEEILSK